MRVTLFDSTANANFQTSNRTKTVPHRGQCERITKMTKVLKYTNQRHHMTSKSQSLSIFIISSFTTTPLAISYSSIICHPSSNIPVEGEYRPSLKDCLIVSGSSSEAPASTFAKIQSVTTITDLRPRPLTLLEHGARCAPVFLGALAPCFPFLARGTERSGGASARAGTTLPSTGYRASAFEEKPNNTREQAQ
jgi:hypothetical protein